MNALQLVASGTDMCTRKNKNIISRKIFTDKEKADDYMNEFYATCIRPIKGCPVYFDQREDVSIIFLNLEIVGS